MKIKGDILITDPCYWMRDEEFNKYCLGAEPGEIILLNPINNMQGMMADTIYGDWHCEVYKTDGPVDQSVLEDIIRYNKAPIGTLVGEFTADAGLVSISEYNETWDYDKKKAEDLVDKYTWTAALLNNFDGDITFVDIYPGNDSEPVRCIIGKGNYNFYTIQVG
ncbi:hypothetical protein [Lachnospira sp.]|jgi:hypothetical protein|uniref:hypothetical protein n=1 Tax=Lachnospira sp. TaxID=2049031 RepID=UPI00257978F3|nr:hypothetical protein [Lachnospira sp.]